MIPFGFIIPVSGEVFTIICIVFTLWALADCWQKEAENRVAWVLLILLLPILGASIYYLKGCLSKGRLS